MTKIKTLLVFFALVFGFCAFSDYASEPIYVCSEAQCNSLKEYLNIIYRVTNETYNDIDRKREDIWYANSNIKRYVSNLDTDQSSLLAGLNYETSAIDTLATQMGYSINYWNATSGGYGTQFRNYIDNIDCSACSNGQCIDLSVVTNILSQITAINTNLLNLTSDIDSSFYVVTNTLLLIQNSVSNIEDTTLSITNSLGLIHGSVSVLVDSVFPIYQSVSDMEELLTGINGTLGAFLYYIQGMFSSVQHYLPYLQTISNDLKSFSSNLTFNVDQNYTNQFYYSNLLTFDRFRYYAQGQLKDTFISLYPLSPYDNLQHLRDATIYDAVAAGFESLLISQGSINNYLYWLKAVAGSNRLESVENHIFAVSNLVGRLDDYVMNDFSNEIVKISNNLSYLTNRVDYTTNFVHLAELVETNNVFLSSIDSKLDVLDYIKILSTTPLSSYSGDVDYYDYLTNLYINGSADSGGVSTNWFERMEILLSSLVFCDSDGTNDIPQSVEMEGVDSSTVETALSDFTYNQEFTGAITALDDTKQSFISVLNGLHTSIKSVSLPASISIGLGGLDGEDTHNFEDMMHGHFQVSFNTGVADRFTIAVRAVTTVSWVLLFFLALWKSGFYLIRKLVYFYRLVTRLLVSVFTR